MRIRLLELFLEPVHLINVRHKHKLQANLVAVHSLQAADNFAQLERFLATANKGQRLLHNDVTIHVGRGQVKVLAQHHVVGAALDAQLLNDRRLDDAERIEIGDEVAALLVAADDGLDGLVQLDVAERSRSLGFLASGSGLGASGEFGVGREIGVP